jgi:hypothetical protein
MVRRPAEWLARRRTTAATRMRRALPQQSRPMASHVRRLLRPPQASRSSAGRLCAKSWAARHRRRSCKPARTTGAAGAARRLLPHARVRRCVGLQKTRMRPAGPKRGARCRRRRARARSSSFRPHSRAPPRRVQSPLRRRRVLLRRGMLTLCCAPVHACRALRRLCTPHMRAAEIEGQDGVMRRFCQKCVARGWARWRGSARQRCGLITPVRMPHTGATSCMRWRSLRV